MRTPARHLYTRRSLVCRPPSVNWLSLYKPLESSCMRPKSWSPIPPGDPLVCGIGNSYATRRDHGTSDYQLQYTVAGSGRFACADRSLAFTTAPGDLVLLQPGTTHDYGPEGAAGWRWIWVHFHAPEPWLPLLSWPEAAPGSCLLHAGGDGLAGRIKRRLLEMESLARGSSPRRGWLAMNALEEVLLWCDSLQAGTDGRRIDPRLRRVLDRLAQDLETPCRRAELARLAGVSVSRLAALFQREVGTGITQHRDRLRLGRAAQLLRATNEPVQRIAAAVGYENPFHFSVRFKAFTGRSPREYRASR